MTPLKASPAASLLPFFIWTQAAAHILRQHRPNLLLFHLLNLDSTQHRYGPRTPAAMDAMAHLDSQVSTLLDTLQDPDAPDPQQLLDASELKDRLADAIAALPEREKLVIALYYYENLTLREIGEVLGVTESRISQLRTQALRLLREGLNSSLAPELLTVAAGGPRTRKGCLQRRRTEYFERVATQGNLRTRLALTDARITAPVRCAPRRGSAPEARRQASGRSVHSSPDRAGRPRPARARSSSRPTPRGLAAQPRAR